MNPDEREPHGVRAWRRRRRILRGLTIAAAIVALASWLICGVSYLGEWDVFLASAPRRHAPGSLAPNTNTPLTVERDERHLMLGRGRFILRSMLVYTSTFDSPHSTANSRALSWATVDQFPHGRFELGWTGGPRADITLYLPASVLTVGCLALVLLQIRRPRPGRCAYCRYDLSGNADRAELAGRCPECGEPQPCAACGFSLLGLTIDTPCPECGWDRRY
jgi:hypothetical protein